MPESSVFLSGVFGCSIYCLIIAIEATPQEEAKQEEDHKALPQSCEEIEGYLRLRGIRAAVPLSLNTNSEMAS